MNDHDVLSAQHGDWISHPVTVQTIKNLEKMREHHINMLSKNAFCETPAFIQSCAIAINTLDGVLSMLRSTTKFIEITKK